MLSCDHTDFRTRKADGRTGDDLMLVKDSNYLVQYDVFHFTAYLGITCS